MNIDKEFMSNYKHFFLLAFWPLILVWFFLCEKALVPKFYMYSRLDDYIPFVKWFVIPYVLWYFYLAAGFLYLGFKSKPDFVKLCIYLFSGVSICYIIYTIFPNAQNLRVPIVDNDILSQAVILLYSIDTPTNVCPSIHVFDATVIHVCIHMYMRNSKKGFFNATYILSFLLMLFSSLSTVFIKQHSIIDLFSGIALAALLYFPVYVMPAFFADKAVAKRVEE